MDSTATLLPLDAPRVIRLTINKQPVDITFERIGASFWRRCLEAYVSRVEIKNGVRAVVEDAQAALADLAGSSLRTVEVLAAGSQPTPVPSNQVPPKLLVAAGAALAMVSATVDKASGLLSEFIGVDLEAVWSRDQTGKMAAYTGLAHIFRQPTIDQLRRFKMGTARTLYTGDAKNGTTVYPSRLAVALTLYDELITDVQGYSQNGSDLFGAKPAEIAAAMDGLHKAVAVLALFDRDDQDVMIGSPDEEDDDEEAAAAA